MKCFISFIFVTFFPTSIFSQKTINIDCNYHIQDILKRMPRIYCPNCEQLSTENERMKCAEEKMLKKLYENLNFKQPNEPIEGICVIRFLVSKNSVLQNFQILRDIGNGAGKAALNAAKTLGEERWIPALSPNGKEVWTMQFNLPVEIKSEN